MKLRELFETLAGNGTVGVCFGRWNPPHKGHRAAWEEAATNDHWYVGTNQNTQGPNDPLPYDVKLLAMEAIYPEIKGHVIPEKNLFTLAAKIYSKHGDVILNIYTDEEWLAKNLEKYNGKEADHGYYKFSAINHVPTARLSSATALRSAVRRNDREEFAAAAGVDADTPIKIGGKRVKFFDLVKQYLDQFPEKVKKTKALAEEISGAGFKAKGKMKKIDATQKAAMKNASTIPGLNQSHGSAYVGWRFGIALAGAPTYPTEMEADTWIGGDPLLSTYTDIEWEMIKKAAQQVGAGNIQNWSGDRSKEVADVNKTSPVAKPKKNKYGI